MALDGQPARPIQIIQITDFHLLADPDATMLGINTQQSFEAVLEHLADFPLKPDLFLLTGDLVQDASVATYERLKSMLSTLPAPVYCLPGNHDDPELISEVLADGQQIFFETHIKLDGWDLICLNSTIAHNPCGLLSDYELSLLDARLGTIAGDRHVLIGMHHPPMALGSRWLDTMMVGNSEDFWSRLDGHDNVHGIIIGHVHQSLDVTVGNRRVFASPSTCFQFKPLSDDFAIDAIPQGFRWICLGVDGSIDTGVERLARVPNGLDLASIGY